MTNWRASHLEKESISSGRHSSDDCFFLNHVPSLTGSHICRGLMIELDSFWGLRHAVRLKPRRGFSYKIPQQNCPSKSWNFAIKGGAYHIQRTFETSSVCSDLDLEKRSAEIATADAVIFFSFSDLIRLAVLCKMRFMEIKSYVHCWKPWKKIKSPRFKGGKIYDSNQNDLD